MVYIPTNSPLDLIEFELIAFKNALAGSPDVESSKPVLIFPHKLDPIINRLIRLLASKMHLRSYLIGDYQSEVVVVYSDRHFRDEEHLQEEVQITTQDFLRAKSLGVNTKVEFAQPTKSSSQYANVAPLNLTIKKDSGRIETKWQKPAPSQYFTEAFFNFKKKYHNYTFEEKNIEQPAHGKRKAKTKWIKSLIAEKELSLSSISSAPMDLDECSLESFSNDVHSPAVASTSRKSTHTIVKPPAEPNWTENIHSCAVASTSRENTQTIVKPPAEPQCTEDQSVRGKRKAKIKWINSMKRKSLSVGTSPPPLEMKKCSYVPEKALFWGTHDAILLPLGYMKWMPQHVLSLFSERVPGMVRYDDKDGQPLEFPASIYIMPPDNEEEVELLIFIIAIEDCEGW
ncbi:hypothetical protein RI129_011584 [Pyrocoelia pectoralis]|uniref:Uncharacterized protein n=1 Tax=Pyrocoelia pectoralis TaxID=417401 RepID=A0AAN7ZD30_9COLE